MKDETERTFFITGFFLFLISMILPAFSEHSNFYGFQTAIIALIAPFSSGWDSNVFFELFFRSHLLLLGLHNIILPVTMFMFHKIKSGSHRWLAILFLISLFNTVLFFFMNRFSVDYEKLLIGYYVWVSASLCIAYPIAVSVKLVNFKAR